VISSLVKSVDGLELSLIQTKQSPQSAMTQWLITQDAPFNFSVGSDCDLKASDESKSTVKFAKLDLDRDDVRKHIAEGKLPTRLAMSWSDRVSFSLTNEMQLKKIGFFDVVFESGDAAKDGFDASFA
jgi:recombination associated protein RdgC